MTADRRRYEEPRPISRDAAEAALKGGDSAAACRALVGLAYHDPDWKWVQDKCLELLYHENDEVRRLAATCLGHVARIHRRLEVEKVRRALEPLKKDPAVAGQAGDALDDIAAFMKRPRD